jgi:membrane protein YdbS with pleckstrin-like domain
VSFLFPLLADVSYEYQPFRTPLPVWNYWYLLLVPLCLAIAIVYKSVRCDSMRRVPREAMGLFVFILVVMVITAGALAGLVNALGR